MLTKVGAQTKEAKLTAARTADREEERLLAKAKRRIMDEELGPSPTATGRHIEAKKEQRRQRVRERRAERTAKKSAERAQLQAEAANETALVQPRPAPSVPGDTFAIDTKPTSVDWAALTARSERAERAAAAKAKQEAPDMNRAARRRLKLIARQREKIIKEMGVTADSDEKMEEVDAKVAEWTETTDKKTEERSRKKKERKEQEATRLRTRRGKLLKGRQLKEREKQLRQIEKRNARKERRGISAQNE
jgi:hypothetical protein